MSDLKELIDDVVAGNHILYHHGIVDGYGHISFRSPTNPERFYMAAAVSPGRVTEADIIELDLDGNVVGDKDRATYSEKFIHAECYRARKDVECVIHSHSPTTIPFGVTRVPLKPIIHGASFLFTGCPVYNSVDVPESTSPLVNNPATGKALAKVLGRNAVALMRGHGDTVVGADIRSTVSRAIYTEVNAKLLLQALSLGQPIEYMNEKESATMQGSSVNQGRGSSHGVDRVWRMWLDEVAAHKALTGAR
jgi:HCOMODA/2-hydroxy-3-carboxy-muconic semialdehyde decarboxylase